jgi:hypothetical protein
MTKINRLHVLIAAFIPLFAAQFYLLFFIDHGPNPVMFIRTRPENIVWFFTALIGAGFILWRNDPAVRSNAPRLAIAGCLIVLLIDALVWLDPALASRWMLLLVSLVQDFVCVQILRHFFAIRANRARISRPDP